MRGEERRGQESRGRGEACDAFRARFGPTHPKPEGCLRETSKRNFVIAEKARPLGLY